MRLMHAWVFLSTSEQHIHYRLYTAAGHRALHGQLFLFLFDVSSFIFHIEFDEEYSI